MGPGADIGAKTHRDLPQLAAGGAIIWVFCRSICASSSAALALATSASSESRLTMVDSRSGATSPAPLSPAQYPPPLRRAGPRRITFADRQRTVGG